MATFSFFALLRYPDQNESPVRSVTMAAPLQREVSREFGQQSTALLEQDEVEYDPSYKPEDNEVVVIRDFQLPPHLADLRQTQDQVERLTDDEIENGRVTCILGLKHAPQVGRRDLLFQAFSQRQVLRKNNWQHMLLDRNTFKVSDRTGITISSAVTAVLRGADLYFKAEMMVRRFLNLDAVFREATDDEVRVFVQDAMWAPCDVDATITMADQTTRRKITSLARREILTAVTADRIEEQAAAFNLPLQRDGAGRLMLPTDKPSFKAMVRLLSDDIFMGPVSGEAFLSNSKRPYRRP